VLAFDGEDSLLDLMGQESAIFRQCELRQELSVTHLSMGWRACVSHTVAPGWGEEIDFATL
jgi:hypothetical protein